VREVEEFFHEGQKGSSAMPHKRNPVLTENLSGLARLIRGYAIAAMENIPLWHERDISHSAVERVIAPDATILADFMLNRLTTVILNMKVYEEKMLENLGMSRGLIFSEAILLKLVDQGLTREHAYILVQRSAMKAWEEGREFKDVLFEDTELLGHLTDAEIEAAFDLDHALRWVDDIFERIFCHKFPTISHKS
jgi:adenylosuccinate lyase